MSYTLQSTKFEQDFDTPKNKFTINCDYCKNPMQEWGFIHIIPLGKTQEIKFLCSALCRRIYRSIKQCPQCHKMFESIKDPEKMYCSRNCYNKNRQQECGNCQSCGVKIEGLERNKKQPKMFCLECRIKSRRYRYNSHYFCDMCRRWIKKEYAIKPADTKLSNYFVCPKPSCNGNRLKVNAKDSTFNKKRRDVKYIE